MRIVLDCRSVFPGRGGIGRHTEELARWLPKVDGQHEYVLLTTDRQKEPICTADRVRQISFPAGMIDPVWEQVQLPAQLRELGASLYHNPCFALPVVGSGCRQAVTVHDIVFRTHPGLVEPGLRDYLNHWTAHAVVVAEAIITVSEFSRDEICRAYGVARERVHVVYNGISPEFRRVKLGRRAAKLQAQYGLPDRFVLYVGSLEPKKNIDRLLAAFAEGEKSEAEGVGLVVAGSAGGRNFDVGDAIKRAGAGRVTVTGYVPDEDVVALMNLASVFVYPSLYEGFGLPPLEAMACGTPTVVSDATCLPEVVGDGAIIAPAEDVEGLAQAMIRALSDRELRRSLQRRGRARAREFTWERAARETLAIYESVAGPGS